MKIGDRFQQETKYFRNKICDGPDWSIQPEQYKTYPSNKKIKLPKPVSISKYSLNDLLKKRKSIRNFTDKPVKIQELSFLLWASTGIQRKEFGFEFRTAPSAGALYPIETYLTINNVEEIKKGVYHYNIKNHCLEELKLGDFGINIAHAALDQEMCANAAVVFVWTTIFNRSKCKYGQRAYRYIYLDAGHIAENLALTATSLDLGSCQVAALYDDEINQMISIDGINESTIYLSVVGPIK